MGKNHFLGGSTIIPPGSDWYSGIDDPEPRRRTENERLERERKRSLQMASATARQAKEIKKIATKQRRSDEEKEKFRRKESERMTACGELHPRQKLEGSGPVIRSRAAEDQSIEEALAEKIRKEAMNKFEEWREKLLRKPRK